MAEVTTCPENFDLERLQPMFVAGGTLQAILSAEWIPEQSKKAPIGFLYFLGFGDILKWVSLKYRRRGIEFIYRNRASRSPRLILDENIDFKSLEILLRHGLDRRCFRVHQSWQRDKRQGDLLMKKCESDAIADGRRQADATLVRIKNGILGWLARETVGRYPCV